MLELQILSICLLLRKVIFMNHSGMLFWVIACPLFCANFTCLIVVK